MRERLRAIGADVAAALGHVVATVALLWPSIRPGRTLVPADVLTAVTPYRVLAGGVRGDNPALSDAALQFFPWFRFLGESLRRGVVPEWNPLILGGLPVTPNGFVSTWYPAFWLPRWLDPYDAYDVFVVTHLALGAVGMYAFSRCLGAGRFAAWVAGAMALVGGMWVHWSLHLVHLVGMVWLPWALAATHRLVARPSVGRASALAAVIALWWLGGNPQYAYLGSLATGAYAIGRIVQRRAWRASAWFAAGAVAGGLLAAPVLLPSARIADDILRDREPVSAMAGNRLPFHELARVAVQDATGNVADGVRWRSSDEFRMDSPFVGVTALLLTGAGIAAGRSRGRWVLGGLAAATLLLAATGAPHHVLHAALPGYDRFRGAARWLSVLPAVVLPLAGLGLHALVRRQPRARIGVLVAAIGTLLVASAWWVWERSEAGAPHDYLAVRLRVTVVVLIGVVVAAWVALRRPRIAAAIVVACVAFELAFSTPRWYPGVEKRTAYPGVDIADVAAARGGRIIRAGRVRSHVSTFSADVPMAYGIADAQGQTVLFPNDVDRYLRLIDDYGGFARSTNVAPDVLDTRALLSPLLDALDVRTVVAESNVRVPGSLTRVEGPSEPRAYVNDGARAAVVVARASPATVDEMWRSVAVSRWNPARTAAVVGLTRPVLGGGTATGGRTGPDAERWVVDAPAGGFLRVSARFDAGWSSEIDGAPARVYRADGIFRGVVVPPGRHVVTFRYENAAAHDGLLIAVAALALLVAANVGARVRRPSRSQDA